MVLGIQTQVLRSAQQCNEHSHAMSTIQQAYYGFLKETGACRDGSAVAYGYSRGPEFHSQHTYAYNTSSSHGICMHVSIHAYVHTLK